MSDKVLGLFERPEAASFEPWLHPCHRVTLTGVVVRFGALCSWVALLTAIKPIDRVWQNRPIGESVAVALLSGIVLLAYAEYEFGRRTLLLYADRVRVSHLLGVWPLRWWFGKLEWRLADLERVKIDVRGRQKRPLVRFYSFGSRPAEFGLATATEAYGVLSWLEEHGVAVDVRPINAG